MLKYDNSHYKTIVHALRASLIRLQYISLHILSLLKRQYKSLNKNVQTNNAGKINVINQWQSPTHRSGWGYSLEALAPLHNQKGVYIDAFLDKTFGWERSMSIKKKTIPYTKPWIGFLHRPPNIPDWYEPERSIQTILQEPTWIESMPHCHGLFCLSNYMAAWLQERVSVPVSALIHPTETPKTLFSMENHEKNPRKKIVHIGWCLRRIHSFFELHAGEHEKVLASAPMWERGMAIEAPHIDYKGPIGSVTVLSYQTKRRYDKLLSENIAFIHLYDSSANNAIIECIVRNTPILVNPLPAVREYLGDDYPFYFESLEEATKKLSSEQLIAETHAYLQARPKDIFRQEYFRESFVASEVYRGLPTPA